MILDPGNFWNIFHQLFCGQLTISSASIIAFVLGSIIFRNMPHLSILESSTTQARTLREENALTLMLTLTGIAPHDSNPLGCS